MAFLENELSNSKMTSSTKKASQPSSLTIVSTTSLFIENSTFASTKASQFFDETTLKNTIATIGLTDSASAITIIQSSELRTTDSLQGPFKKNIFYNNEKSFVIQKNLIFQKTKYFLLVPSLNLAQQPVL